MWVCHSSANHKSLTTLYEYNFLYFYSPDSLHVPTQFARYFCSVDVITIRSLHYCFYKYLTCILFKPDCIWLTSFIYICTCRWSATKPSFVCLMTISYPFVIWLNASYMLATFHVMSYVICCLLYFSIHLAT